MPNSPAVLILAGGASTRFGSPKQLAEIRGDLMLPVVAARAVEVVGDSVTVVLGAHASEIARFLRRLPVSIVINSRWHEGLGSSIRAGIRSLSSNSAVLLWLGDQAAVTPQDLKHLIEAWNRNPAQIAASVYADSIGVPAIFPRAFFNQLLKIRGDRGAKGLLLRNLGRLTKVPTPNAALDVDVPGTLQQMMLQGGSLSN